MLLLLATLALLQWGRLRQFTPDEPKTKVPYDPRHLPIFLTARKWLIRLWLVGVVAFVGLLATYEGYRADVESSAQVVDECHAMLHDQPLASCLANGHEAFMSAFGKAASMEVWLWTCAIL